jgi:hypothetical protein
MTDDLDTLLKDDWLQPPPGFSQRVMHKLGAQILPPLQHKAPVHEAQTAGQSLGRRLRWLAASAAWAAGGLLGLSQLAAFVFGLWLTAAAL